MSINPVEIEELESKAGNIYEAVVVAAKRARQINDEHKLEYNQRVEPLTQTETDDDTLISKDKMNISVDFEKRIKPTEQGLDELLDDRLEFRLRSEASEDLD
ncbi:MAG TPA: DNA-directed RNA polymerase subunit omega [Ignavibacteria bacterium]|jgi:DNA-directed RNA polymerase omega subunit